MGGLGEEGQGRKEGAWSAVQRMTLVAGRTAGERSVGVWQCSVGG